MDEFIESQLEGIRRAYVEAYAHRLEISKVLRVQEVASADQLQLFARKFSVVGPATNRGSTTWHDDTPLASDVARGHADSYQYIPLFGIDEYNGEVLFKQGHTKVVPLSPISSADGNQVAAAISDAATDYALRYDIPIAIVAPPLVLRELQHPLRRPSAVDDLQEISRNVQYVSIPRAPKNRLFVLPVDSSVATLHVFPALGQVVFDNPTPGLRQHTLVASSWNRLVVRDRSKILEIPLHP